MTFDARDHLVDLPNYEFTGLDGVTYTLPNIAALTMRQLMAVAAGDMTVLREINEKAYEAILDMPVTVSEQLAADWVQAGEQAGKSPSPPPPPGPTRSRSTPSSPGSP